MVSYYTSIKNIPVWNFYEILNTGTLTYLFKDEPDPEATVAEMQKVWTEIYNEYCKAGKVDNRHLKQIGKVEELKLKHYKITQLLNLCSDSFPEVREAAKNALKGHNYIFRSNQPYGKEMDRLRNQLTVLKTKIQIEESKLPKKDKKEAVSLMKQVVALEEIEPNWKVDIYSTPVEKWLAYWERAKEKMESRKQAHKR